jgi:hypothetical protein
MGLGTLDTILLPLLDLSTQYDNRAASRSRALLSLKNPVAMDVRVP